MIRALTALPVTVLPSHLHFDHTGGIGVFHSIAMLDLPATRADVHDGRFTPGRYEFHGMSDGLHATDVHGDRVAEAGDDGRPRRTHAGLD